MVKAKLLQSARCVCGHDKPSHGTGLKMYGSDNLACAIVGCECEAFELEVVPKQTRAKIVRTLDKDEPKMFEVESAANR